MIGRAAAALSKTDRVCPRLGRGWNAFWFAPVDPAALAAVRIVFAAVVLLWALSLAPDLGAFYSAAGVAGTVGPEREWYEWSLLDASDSELAIGAVYVALVGAAAGLLVGRHSRCCAVVVFVALTSLARANPYVVNSGDTLLRLLALYLALAPSGAALSLDRRRARRHGAAAAPVVRAWPLRLIQIQVTVMYLAAVWSKLGGDEWRDGTAASFATRLPDLVRFPVPDALAASAFAAQVATYGTIAIEAGLVVLLWHRRTRTAALAAGLLFHLSIDLSIRVGFFTLAVLTAYVAFTDPAWWRRAAARAGYASATPGRVSAQMTQTSSAITRIAQNG